MYAANSCECVKVVVRREQLYAGIGQFYDRCEWVFMKFCNFNNGNHNQGHYLPSEVLNEQPPENEKAYAQGQNKVP